MEYATDLFVMVPDKLIRIDDVTLIIENDFPADMTIHAIHWYGDNGEIEYVDHVKNPNVKFGKDKYQSILEKYILAWNAQKALEDQREEEAKKKYNSTEQRFVRLRARRDARLTACDYVMTIDYYQKLTPENQAEWTEYRQALRDLTSLEGAPWDGGDDGTTVPWPTKPDIVKLES